MRKLVTIRKVIKRLPIEGADLIELVRIDGWQCVVKKGEFAEGDNGLYFEIDSFLPLRPEFEFLRPSSYHKLSDGSEGFRLRTLKLRGCLSQGLLLPLQTFNLTMEKTINIEDLALYLGVVKYEPPIPACLAGAVKGIFPGLMPKTDEERIQNLSDYFEQYREVAFEATVKLDGTSMTCFVQDGQFGVCSRNLELLESEANSYWKVVKALSLKEKMLALGRNLAIQGELIGEGIQGNKEKLKGQRMFVFSVFDIDRQAYLAPAERRALAAELGLDHVPVLAEEIKIFSVCRTMEEILEWVAGPSLNASIREGVVFKALAPEQQRVHFKVINNKFLLKFEGA